MKLLRTVFLPCSSSKESIMSQYGFVRVPREVEKAIPVVNASRPQAVVPPPNSETARLVREYAAKELTAPVLNHSLRVFQYSVAIIRDQFPAWDLDQEVLYVTCLLHDIATTDQNMRATKMSFVSIMVAYFQGSLYLMRQVEIRTMQMQ